MNRYAYFLFLPFHLILLTGLAVNYDRFIWQYGALLIVLWTLFSGFGIGAGFHRLLAHKAYKTSKFWTRTCSVLGCFGLQGSPLFWVSVHRAMHHPFSDTLQDYHSPIHGKFWAYMGWPLMINMNKINAVAVRDLIFDNFQVQIHKNYIWIIIGTIFLNALIFPIFTSLSLLPAIALTLHQEFCVNLFCHIRGFGGYRNFDTKDQTVNRPLLGLLWGVGYHNNHHSNPSNYDFGFAKWWELDFTKYIIKAIKT